MGNLLMGQDEILANRVEDDLLKELATAMKERGFTLLGVLAICDEDQAVATFGDTRVTHSVNFGTLLHDLGQQIQLDAESDHRVKNGNGRQAPAHPINLANLHLCKRHN